MTVPRRVSVKMVSGEGFGLFVLQTTSVRSL